MASEIANCSSRRRLRRRNHRHDDDDYGTTRRACRLDRHRHRHLREYHLFDRNRRRRGFRLVCRFDRFRPSSSLGCLLLRTKRRCAREIETASDSGAGLRLDFDRGARLRRRRKRGGKAGGEKRRPA